MQKKIFINVILLIGLGFSEPFYYHEIVLSGTKYSVSIDSGQKVFGAIDTLCLNKKYFYFHVLEKPVGIDTIKIIKKTSLREGDTFSITYYFTPNHDKLPCDSTVLINNIKNQNLLNDTTKIPWVYGPPVSHKTKSINHSIVILHPHIRLSLKNGNDSSSITLTKEPIISSGSIKGFKASLPLNGFFPLTITTFSSLRTSAASGAHIVLFDMCGKKFFDSQQNNFPEGRLSGKVVLYKIEDAHASPVWGKIVVP